MRLELLPLDEGQNPHAAIRPMAARWVLERGRRTLGRSADCDWRLPEDERAVSKIHCVIERKGDDFVLEDRSSNGSVVDGTALHDGASTVLKNRSRLEIGTVVFQVQIEGERSQAAPDAAPAFNVSSEALTISSILADIVPAGQLAGSAAGPRESEDPFAFISPPKDKAPSSRNVQIGWAGPPTPQTIGAVIPDDWYDDADGHLAHSLEHSTATRVSVPMRRPATREVDQAESGQPVVITEDVGLSGLPLSEPSSRLAEIVHRLELALDQTKDLLHAQTGAAGAVFGHSAGGSLEARLEAVLATQLQLNDAIERMMQNSAHLFDPTMLEDRLDRKGKPAALAWMRDAAYWRAYRSQFSQSGRRLSAADLLRRAPAGVASEGQQTVENAYDGRNKTE